MIRCPRCHAEIDQNASSCSSCGLSFDDATRPLEAKPSSSKRQFKSSTPSAESIDDSRFVPGTILTDRYRIIGLLGKGGMGEVYRADDLKLAQPVALKFLSTHFADDPEAVKRLYQEVRIARQVSHPNVCRVYDVGEIEGQLFISMEFIKGEELASLLRRIGHLPQDKAIEIARQVCAGLAAAHNRGVLHRDLKPANVMIDEHGNARLTDFGIAALAEEVQDEKHRAGTPAYMSPEQLSGGELTTKSDLYSLGLVLYEIFTGKRAFDAPTLGKLIELRRSDTTPRSPSSLVQDLDPLIEKVIERCLQKNPELRPASALQVAAALPGGDPLAAALAAGETPSPEMVAAAPKEGSLTTALAVPLFGAVLIGLVAIVLLAQRTMLHNLVPFDKSPEVLSERARQVMTRLGYSEPPVDTYYSFSKNDEALQVIRQRDKSPNRWNVFRSGELPYFYFGFVQSPRYIVPRGLQFEPPEAMYISGMTWAILDSQGRLQSFYAVPPQVEANINRDSRILPQTNWATVFDEAGLDISKFKPVESRWTPPQYGDSRVAWQGVMPGPSQIPITIEAASYQGKPVYFEVVFPWDRAYRQTEYQVPGGQKIATFLVFGIFFAVLIFASLLARRNVRLGRGDRKGAFRLAMFMLAVSLARDAFWVHYTPTPDEFWQLILHFGVDLVAVVTLWVTYLALEPMVRRNWPQRMVSWSRFIAGDFRDALVARDVLFGAVAGVGLSLIFYSGFLVPSWFGGSITFSETPSDYSFTGLRGLARETVEIFGVALAIAVVSTFLLLLLFVVLRREWIAAVAFWVVVTLLLALGGNFPLVDFIGATLAAAVFTFVLLRFGLLSLFSLQLFRALTTRLPLTSNFSSWLAPGTAVALIILIAIAAYAAYSSLGSQRLGIGKLLGE